MIRQIAIATLSIVSIAAFAPKTMAQTADVTFSGTVPTTCTFGASTAGVLTPNLTTNPTILASSVNIGSSSGSVTVTCNAAAHLTVAPPSSTGAALTTSSIGAQVAFASSPSTNTDSTGKMAALALPSGATPLKVDMSAQSNTTINPGTYSYKVTLTVTP